MWITLGASSFVLTLVAVLVVGSVASAKRAGLARTRSLRLGACVGVVLSGWLLLVAVLAASGLLADVSARPPRLPILPSIALLAMVLVGRSALFSRLLAATPLAWPIAIQGMRAFVEVGLWALFRAGEIPVHMTFEGKNFDVLVGLSAPLIALGVARGTLARRWVVAWNIGGLCLLATIVFLAVTAVPGPTRLPWPGVPNTIVLHMPMVWLPAFVVPLAFAAHVASLRQLLVAKPGDVVGSERQAG
jgi:hypothetical protein